jgi:hypothetical protein
MTDWWPLLAVFWAWFLFDCVKVSRRPRFLFSHTPGGGIHAKVRTAFGNFTASAPTPCTWHALTEDPPFSFSPEGLANVAIGSAGRPSPEPLIARAWRWDEIREVRTRRGRVWINGVDFCGATPFADAAELRALAAKLTPLPCEQREHFLRATLAAWFRPIHLQRRQRVLVARTRPLAVLSVFNFLIALGVSVYLLAGGPALVGETWATRLAEWASRLGLVFLFVHVWTLVAAYRAHRRMVPKLGEQRATLLLNAALLPPHALRLRAQIAAQFFPPHHPLAWLAALGRTEDLAVHARHTLADLRWPLASRQNLQPALVATISTWMRERVAAHAENLLHAAPLDAEKLFAPPEADSAASCLFCPRCRDQFTDPAACCPRGVPLQALK